MTNLENLQTSLLWLIVIFIVVSYFLPSLSSFIKEKLTGKDEQEKFDLDQMVSRKQEVMDRLAHEHRHAFEKSVFISNQRQTIELLKEMNWGRGPAAQELVAYSQNLYPEKDITWQQLRISYQELLKIEAFNQSERYTEFNTLCELLVNFTLERIHSDNPDQNAQIFLEIHNRLKN